MGSIVSESPIIAIRQLVEITRSWHFKFQMLGYSLLNIPLKYFNISTIVKGITDLNYFLQHGMNVILVFKIKYPLPDTYLIY